LYEDIAYILQYSISKAYLIPFSKNTILQLHKNPLDFFKLITKAGLIDRPIMVDLTDFSTKPYFFMFNTHTNAKPFIFRVFTIFAQHLHIICTTFEQHLHNIANVLITI